MESITEIEKNERANRTGYGITKIVQQRGCILFWTEMITIIITTMYIFK